MKAFQTFKMSAKLSGAQNVLSASEKSARSKKLSALKLCLFIAFHSTVLREKIGLDCNILLRKSRKHAQNLGWALPASFSKCILSIQKRARSKWFVSFSFVCSILVFVDLRMTLIERNLYRKKAIHLTAVYLQLYHQDSTH